MDNRGSLFFFLIVLYLLLSSQSRPPLVEQSREHEIEVEREQDALRRLNESRYGDFDPRADRWLPFAGVRKNDSYAWDLLSDAQDRARRQLRSSISDAGLDYPSTVINLSHIHLPVYRNATGKLLGDWVRNKHDSNAQRLNVTAIALEHEYFTHEFSQNITGPGGTLYLDLHDGGGEEFRLGDRRAREIRASLAVESNDYWGHTWYLSLLGIHYPETGGIILTTTSEKFGGLFALPHFTFSPDSYELAHQLLLKSLSDTISQKEVDQPTLFPWSSVIGSEQVEFPAPRCEHIIYLQQHPIAFQNYLAEGTVIEQIEKELRYPMGAPVPSPPLMVMSAVVFSPDCGYILETKGAPEFPPSDALYLSGPKLEEYSKYSSRLLFLISGVLVGQITLLLRQIKEASTPSTRSRISFYTIAMMSFGDAFVLVFLLLELYSAVSFLLITTVSFLTFLSVSYIGMKFMMEIWAVQAPERQEQIRRSNQQSSSTATDSLPPPATARRMGDTDATPVILTPDQDPPEDETTQLPNRNPTPSSGNARADVGAMYARFYLILFLLLITSIWSFLWPVRLGSIYARTLSFIYLSLWCPQIYRNAMRNCRKALRWDFVVGESVLRLSPFIYFLTVRGNVLFIRPDSITALAMTGWVWIQVWLLAVQDILGPRFFVPRGWAPPAYDYHPILRDNTGPEQDLESGGTLPIGSLRADEREPQAEDKSRPKYRKKAMFDCAICMQEMEVPVLGAPGAPGGSSSVADGATSILTRRTYMVTPCRHIFHSTCLESWMRLRLQCPICRESIPPV